MPSSTLSKRKTNWGVVLTTAAAIGNSVLPIPVPAFWKPVIGAVAWSTVILCCVAWALTHFTWLARVRLYFASRKRMAFVLVFFVAGLVGVSIYWGLEKSNAESPQVAATHIETANAFEITGQINSAAPLQKDDVARGYQNGRVDWKVGLASVKPVRGDPQNIEAIFSPTSGRPPNHPLISCVVAKKGHEYLGTMVQRPGELPVFRIQGVLTEIDYEHESMTVSGASIEQLPPNEETTALTNDQLAKKAERQKQNQASPSPPQKIPTREEGPKVVPPSPSAYEDQMARKLAYAGIKVDDKRIPIERIGAPPIELLQIEALPISARTENLTQLGTSMKGSAVFRGKCIFSIRNPNRTHGFTGIGCRLISIEPPLRSSAGYRAMTENYTLRRIKFPIDDIENNTLRGDQTAHVHILTATRKPFAEPRTLRNVTINIEGKWPEKSANEFTPQAEHMVTLEVAGDGLQTRQVRFSISFSAQFEDDVFSISKLATIEDSLDVEPIA